MNSGDLELLAEAAYLRAGLPINAAASPLHVAGQLFGWSNVGITHAAPTEASVVGSQLLIQRGLTKRQRSWFAARALAAWLLEKFPSAKTEASTEMLAACLRTPRDAFRSLALETGPAFSDLAWAFQISEASAVLRFGEVLNSPVALVDRIGTSKMRGRMGSARRGRRVALNDAKRRYAKLFAV